MHASRARPNDEFGAETFGNVGEAAVREAIARTNRFIIGEHWGDLKDARILGASDGIIYSPTQPVKEAAVLVEIKNKREWIYHEAFELWKHIRNAYAMDAIPLFVARRIHELTCSPELCRG